VVYIALEYAHKKYLFTHLSTCGKSRECLGKLSIRSNSPVSRLFSSRDGVGVHRPTVKERQGIVLHHQLYHSCRGFVSDKRCQLRSHINPAAIPAAVIILPCNSHSHKPICHNEGAFPAKGIST